MITNELKDKIAGCLIAGAAGDALGYPVEFISSFAKIAKQYGPEGITAYDRSHPWNKAQYDQAQISDDTQMTLYSVEAMLEARKQGVDYLPLVSDAYLMWFAGQTGQTVPMAYRSELAGIPDFNLRRAPGNTCLSALQSIAQGQPVYNDSKGCGGVMRVAPVGLLGAITGVDLTETAIRGGEVAEITHKHAMSTFASAAMAVIVRMCAERTVPLDVEEFRKLVVLALGVVGDVFGSEADLFINTIKFALSKTDDPRPDHEVIEDCLGEGWVAEETLAIAVFCVTRHIDSVADTLTAAVNHGGDSDSTGAVAGNIIGAILGYKAIPESLTADLQFHDLILDYASRFSAS